jgi:hypothetical protein
MNRTKLAIVAVVILAVAFLSGLLVGYLEVRESRAELGQLRNQTQLGELRDLASLIYVETSRQNFGLARQYAGRYFDAVNRLSQSDSLDPAIRASLEPLLAHRDEITAALARAEPSAGDQTQALYLDTYTRTTRQARQETRTQEQR